MTTQGGRQVTRDAAAARYEVAAAQMFGREPRAWAIEVLDAERGPERVAEARNEAARASMFGREVPAGVARTLAEAGESAGGAAGRAAAREVDVRDFRRCGLSEGDAERAVKGIERGIYGSFREAALLVSTFPSEGQRMRSVDPGRVSLVVSEREQRNSCGVQIEERRSPTAGPGRRIVERATTTAAVVGTKLQVCLISAGQGSSGYYSPAVLEQAARDKVFHEGLHMYLDHPTSAEDIDRPERSVRDLAGALATDAVYRDDALFAEVDLFESARQMLPDAVLPHIGLSIRGAAEMDGQNIARIVSALSVDLVTRAGRGGRFVL